VAITRALPKVLEGTDPKRTIAAFQNGEAMSGMLRKAISEFLENRKPTTAFTTWRTVKLGTHKDAKALHKSLKKAACKVSSWANDILSKITVAQEETEAGLVICSVADLGLKKGARYDAICERANKLGLELCPAEVGPQLRLQYNDQPRGEWLRITMEPVTVSGGGLDIFRVGHDDDGLWLRTYCGYPVIFWSSDDRFVFVLRK
jgi:hypothetical protein